MSASKLDVRRAKHRMAIHQTETQVTPAVPQICRDEEATQDLPQPPARAELSWLLPDGWSSSGSLRNRLH